MATNSTPDDGQEAGEVVARDRALGRVVDGLDTGHDPESAEEEGECRAEPGAQPWVGPRDEDEHASGTRPLTRWSLADVPGCGWRKLSSATWSATTPSAARAATASVKTREPVPLSSRIVSCVEVEPRSPFLLEGHLRSSNARSTNSMTRRSYSAGWASMPPVCSDPGTLHIAFGSPAAA